MQQTQTLYEKLGGEEAISKVVDYLYEQVLANDTVNHFGYSDCCVEIPNI